MFLKIELWFFEIKNKFKVSHAQYHSKCDSVFPKVSYLIFCLFINIKKSPVLHQITLKLGVYTLSYVGMRTSVLLVAIENKKKLLKQNSYAPMTRDWSERLGMKCFVAPEAEYVYSKFPTLFVNHPEYVQRTRIPNRLIRNQPEEFRVWSSDTFTIT